MANAAKVVYDGFIKALKPDAIALKVSGWADNFRYLSSKASSEPGRWRTSRTPYLKEVLDKLSSQEKCDTVVFMKAAQIGAALDLKTPIPTPNGFIDMGDLKVGDKVYGADGKPCNVTFATDAMLNHVCYKVHFSDGSVITADADHRWGVIDSNRQEYCIKTTQEILALQASFFVPAVPGQYPKRRITAIEKTDSVPVRCIQVDSQDHLYLAGKNHIPTHNTEAGNCWLGYIIDLAPGPVMMVQPTVDMIKRLTRQRLDPMLEDTPTLASKVTDRKSREGSNTMFIKEFPGGMLLMAGANSPTGLRSAPMRYLFLDEVDAYPEDCGGEGSPIKLAEARTRTFKRNRKIFIVSTPSIKATSQIEKAFNSTDQKYFFVPCPHCEQKQKLVFANLKWEAQDYDSVRYICEHCGAAIKETSKNYMLENGEWIATATPVNKRAVGYHINALYSPLGWFSWADVALEWEDAQGDILKLKSFVNTILGESWEDRGDAPDHEELYARRESYELGTVPAQGLFLTCGVDVQKDRIEAEVVAWGRNKESWSVDYLVFRGDTQMQEVWEDFSKWCNSKKYQHAQGCELEIKLIAVDSGNNTQIVYNAVRDMANPKVICIKGVDSRDSAQMSMVGQPKHVDVKSKSGGKTIYRGQKFWPIYVGIVKDELYAFLRRKQKAESEYIPTGYCHFPEAYDLEYFKQLCAEHKITKTIASRTMRYWQKVYDRNEALDCRVYARAAAFILGYDRMEELHFQEMENAIYDLAENLKQNQGYNEPKGGIQVIKSDFW